ncbi:MAG: T9SS type A sorting domain-containing protein [Phaeodactylibacter sp.]|nr:T9SS type A sorting domain-containing protein [Phaeodactylibacter sp.]
MNLLKYFLFVFLLHFSQQSFSQPFSLPINLSYPLNHFRDMIIDQDTIIGYGLGFSNDSIPQQGLLLSKFDSLGNHLFSRMILDPEEEPLFIDYHWGKITKTRDGGYIMTAAPTHGDAAWLIKTNHEFEVEFIKEYLDTINRSHYRYIAPVELSDGYLLSGAIQRPNYLNNAFARRVDSVGNTVWFSYFGEYEVGNVINSSIKITDSLFLLCGTADTEGVNTASTTIRYINGEGNLVRSWESETNPEIGYCKEALPFSDGKLITFGLYLAEVVNEASMVQPTLARLDSNFQIEWVNHFSYIARLGVDITFWDMEPLSDGNFIGAGESVTEPGSEPRQRTGWLYKFSPEGEQIWEVLPHLPFLPLSEFDRGNFAGVGELSSGSIVAAGEAIDGSQRHIWLVKVTADGCLDTLCTMVSQVGEIRPEPEVTFSLYPNPASGPLHLAWAGRPPAEEGLIRLFRANGQVIWRKQARLEREMTLDIGGLPDGLYFLQVQAGSGAWVERLVVRGE